MLMIDFKAVVIYKFIYSSLIILLMQCFSFNRAIAQPVTVPAVDLNRYMGEWYEIASFPQRFQKGCHRTKAIYTLHEKGYVHVLNKCNRDSLNGKETSVDGKAFVVKN